MVEENHIADHAVHTLSWLQAVRKARHSLDEAVASGDRCAVLSAGCNLRAISRQAPIEDRETRQTAVPDFPAAP